MSPQGFLTFLSWLLSLVLSHQIYSVTGDKPKGPKSTTNLRTQHARKNVSRFAQNRGMEVATRNFVISRNAQFVNTPIYRELLGEETSAAMRSNAEICALSMLRFVHFMWCFLCTLCAVICAEMWGSQEQSAGGFWGGNHQRVQITSAIFILYVIIITIILITIPIILITLIIISRG